MPNAFWIGGGSALLRQSYQQRRSSSPALACAVLSVVSCLLAYAHYHWRHQVPLLMCAKLPSQDKLADFIWSHRGHIDDGELQIIDATEQAQRKLLGRQIIHFDLDVSVVDGSYYVAHPSTLKLKPKLRQLSSFLLVLASQLGGEASSCGKPLVTLEPKFDDHSEWRRLIGHLDKGIWIHPTCVALIVNEPLQLALVVETPSVTVSIAIRSIPKSPRDYTLASAMAVDTTQTAVLLMPDKVLVSAAPLRFKSPGQSSPSRMIVPWLVNTQDELERLVRHGDVDGIITDRPLEMLQVLERLHKRHHCS